MNPLARIGGVVGPVAFVAAWAVGGERTPEYSPVHDAISRLAEVGAPARPLMTAGFVAFGLAVPAFAAGARHRLGPASAAALAVAGIATLGVAALPLEAGVDDTPHAVAATIGYAGMAAAPLLVRGRSRGDLAVGVLAAASLVATAAGPAHGLFQRLGLGLVDAWIVRRALAAPGRG